MSAAPKIIVSSPNIKYTDDYIFSEYEYNETLVTKKENELLVRFYIYYEINFAGLAISIYRIAWKLIFLHIYVI